MTKSGKTAKDTCKTQARESTFANGHDHEEIYGSEKRERARHIAAEAVLEGLQEAAFICEGYAARLSEGNDHHAEYDAVCECFALIDRRIQEQRQALTGASDTTAQAPEGGNR